ncbi:MAG TPA: hypothetical protein VGI60_00685 [Chthoniobacterales bacterium]|jgi:hypothetical protein
MRSAILSLLIGLTTVVAQEPPAPSASVSPSPLAASSAAPVKSVTLRFALPPLEGTISLGVYNGEGKLVRVLHREDAISEFTAGHDALETTWDGTDDGGKALSNGKYHARGFVVGGLKVEGVNYFFNDWVTDEKSPHIHSLGQIWMESGVFEVEADLAGDRRTTLICDQNTGEIKGELPPRSGAHCPQVPTLPNLISPIDCAPGRLETTWFVDSLGGTAQAEVKQIASDHRLLRRLSYAAGDPSPRRIEASPNEEKIFIIEENDQLQRLRALSLIRTTAETADQSVSDWKTVFEKKIVTHQNFSLENGKPVPRPGGREPALEKVAQKLRPDPLQHDQPGKVSLAVGFDADGSFLQTDDGLPLRTISDTSHLVRVVLGRPNDNTIDVFQDDGAVVEQFRVSNLPEMIAFDCGDFELK